MATSRPVAVPAGEATSPAMAAVNDEPAADGTWDEDILYQDQEDARTIIEPSISAVATHLASPSTPVADRMAVMDDLNGRGYFDVMRPKERSAEPPSSTRQAIAVVPSPSNNFKPAGPLAVNASTQSTSCRPTPWTSGPKQFQVERSEGSKQALQGAFGQSRHSRSTSLGSDALKKLSKALPSFPRPSITLPNISTPSFLSLNSSSKVDSNEPSPSLKPTHQQPAGAAGVPPHVQAGADKSLGGSASAATLSPHDQSRSPALRRSLSQESFLYHTLSRTSSMGDDERFTNIREQVNVRFKAIKDSWDGPNFRLPTLPNIIPSQLKRGSVSDAAQSETLDSKAPKDGNAMLDDVLESLTGDIVVLGGYRGSVLRSAQAPYRQLWVPVKVGLNIRKVNMAVGLDPEDEEKMEEQIFASGMLQNIGPVDISRKLFKKLRECENARNGKLRVHDYGYDWRLSPHLLSRKLTDFLEKLPSNQKGTPSDERGALVIAHSLGGLITRHAVNQRPELFSGVVYAGVPQRCINILGPLRNGDAVLLNEKVLTAQVNFSLRTSFAFLPEDGFCFINKDTREEYRIDFYDVNDWIKYRLSPCLQPPLPPYNARPQGTLGSLLPNLPLRSRNNSASDPKKSHSPPRTNPLTEVTQKLEQPRDRILGPQLDSSGAQGDQAALAPGSPRTTALRKTRSSSTSSSASSPSDSPSSSSTTPSTSSHPSPTAGLFTGFQPQHHVYSRNVAYLQRTLAATRRFRAGLAHDPRNAAAYPPTALVYGKGLPTVYAARVAGRDAIACADCYDDLAFASGDGVVLAREAMLPAGYELVRGGRVSTDRGHLTMLGDLGAVAKALGAVVRGRRKGIGMGERRAEEGQ